MKFYKVHEYYREKCGEKMPIHYYMIFHRSLRTWFKWKWYCTVYSEYWFKRKMKNKRFSLERYVWINNKWGKE